MRAFVVFTLISPLLYPPKKPPQVLEKEYSVYWESSVFYGMRTVFAEYRLKDPEDTEDLSFFLEFGSRRKENTRSTRCFENASKCQMVKLLLQIRMIDCFYRKISKISTEFFCTSVCRIYGAAGIYPAIDKNVSFPSAITVQQY